MLHYVVQSTYIEKAKLITPLMHRPLYVCREKIPEKIGYPRPSLAKNKSKLAAENIPNKATTELP